MELYVDRKTRGIVEAQLFEDFALVRSLDPMQYRDIKKLRLLEFDKGYEPYGGIAENVYDYLAGRDTEVVIQQTS